MTYLSHHTSPLGNLTMASDGDSLIGLWFDGQKYDRANLKNEPLLEKSLPIFDKTKLWLDTYFSGVIPDFTPPLKLSGSDFRRRVGQILLTIPYGHTMTYGDIAKIIAQEREIQENLSLPMNRGSRRGSFSQAVGGAVGYNPISIIIPCHRVIGSPSSPFKGDREGRLTGYAGGLDRKRWLLNHEQFYYAKQQ